MKFRYGSGGALTCDEQIQGITQEVNAEAESFYGYKHFVAESMSLTAACRIAELVSGVSGIEVEYFIGNGPKP